MSRALAAGLGCALALGLAVAALGGCGDADDEPAAPQTASTPARASGAIELSIRSVTAAGATRTSTLTCRKGEQRAGGALVGRARAVALCAKARSIAELLTTQPDQQRACTEIYGGPETGRVSGTIDGTKVDRRFTRTNGCEIADFSRAAALLQP